MWEGLAARTRGRGAGNEGRPHRRWRRTPPWPSDNSYTRASAADRGRTSSRAPGDGSVHKAVGPCTPSWKRGSADTRARGSDWPAGARSAHDARQRSNWKRNWFWRHTDAHTSVPPPSLKASSSTVDEASSQGMAPLEHEADCARGRVRVSSSINTFWSDSALGCSAATPNSRDRAKTVSRSSLRAHRSVAACIVHAAVTLYTSEKGANEATFSTPRHQPQAARRAGGGARALV